MHLPDPEMRRVVEWAGWGSEEEATDGTHSILIGGESVAAIIATWASIISSKLCLNVSPIASMDPKMQT